jgi:broad specificity phosphatase PhoE
MHTPQPQIILVRHARPAFDTSAKVRGSELREAIAAYDASGIDAHVSAQPMPDRPVVLVTSDLRRAVESAKAFFPRLEVSATDALYREAGLPSRIPLLGDRIRLRFSSFVVAMRVLWLLGLESDVEHYRQARQRAEHAAEKLVELASPTNCVILVGHGFLNRLIGRTLRKQGWHAARSQGDGYGAAAVFSLDGPTAGTLSLPWFTKRTTLSSARERKEEKQPEF